MNTPLPLFPSAPAAGRLAAIATFAALLATGLTLQAEPSTGEKIKEGAQEAWRDTKDVSREAWADTKEAAKHAGEAIRDAMSTTWDDVKDTTYADRAQLQSKLSRMVGRIDYQIDEWKIDRDSLSGDARDAWDDSIEAVREARSELKDELDDLDSVSAEDWDDAKADVAGAWQRYQSAYDRLEKTHAAQSRK